MQWLASDRSRDQELGGDEPLPDEVTPLSGGGPGIGKPDTRMISSRE